MTRWLLATLALSVLLFGCGTDSSDDSVNAFSIAAPAMGVTSPTAASSTASASLWNGPSWIKRAAVVPGFAKLMTWFGANARAEETTKPTEVKPFGDIQKEAKSDFLLPPDQVMAKFGGFDALKEYRAPCYGPSWADTLPNGSSPNRPNGDLGIIFATRDDTSTEACAAAEMNALIAGKPQFFNKVQKLVTALLSKADADGSGLPAIGAEVLVTMPTLAGFAFTTAKLGRLADDADGNPVYKTTIEGTAGTKTVAITLYHTPLDATNATFKGLFQAVVPHTGMGAGTSRGVSVVYSQSATTQKYVLETAANRATTSADFFDATTGRLLFTNAAAGEDLNKMIAEFDLATGAATVHYAWQAGAGPGPGDQASRTFAISTTGNTEGSTAVAYFGFGPPLNTGAIPDTNSPIWATKMHCNWLNGTGGGPSIPKIERQTMAFTSGEFRPLVSKINFAPTDTCDTGAPWTITGGPTFKTGVQVAVTNDLVAVATATDISSVTVPTYTKP